MHSPCFFKEIENIKLETFRKYLEQNGYSVLREVGNAVHYQKDWNVINFPGREGLSDQYSMFFHTIELLSMELEKSYIEIMNEIMELQGGNPE